MKIPSLSRLPLALSVLACALALASCTPLRDNTQNTPDKNVVDGETVIPNAANSVEPTDIGNAVSNNEVEAPKVKFSALETIYVPGKDDKLHATKVSRMAMDSQLKSGDSAAPGLQEIIEKSPLYFPKNAKVNSTTQTAKGMNVDLNKAFGDKDFWSQKGERTTQLAVYALVNSAAKTTGAQGKSEPQPVTFTIEKKPVEQLGELDFGGPIDAEMNLVASK